MFQSYSICMYSL